MSRNIDDESNRDRGSTTNAPRIVVQYFRGHTLICELTIGGKSVHFHISPPGEGKNDTGGWRVEARATIVDSEIVIDAIGPTRRAAFTEMSSKWNAEGPEFGLRALDWNAVAAVLTAVRALE